VEPPGAKGRALTGRVKRVITAALLASAAVLAQTAPRPTFEAASIRPRLTPYGSINIPTSGLRLTADAEMLGGFIRYA
jgi:hypothetical protein